MHYNTKMVHSITGLTDRRIDYWDRTHFIKPSVCEASGQGSIRLYSFNDLVQMKVAKTLLDKGLSLQKIRKAVTYLKKNMPDVKQPLSALKFLTDGSSVFVLTKNDRQVIDVLKKGQLMFYIALGDLIEDLKGQVIDVEKERRYKVTLNGREWPVILHADTEDGGYWVECPLLPGCSSQGDTIEEALEMIKDAIQGHLEIVEEDSRIRKKRRVR